MTFFQNKEKMELMLVIGVSFLIFLPFINSGYNSDDPVYLQIADNIRRSPLDPFRGDFQLQCNTLTLFHWNTNGPLVPAYIALVQSLFGGSEKILHLAFYVFVALSAYSMYGLGRHLVGNGVLPAVLFSTLPYFVLQFPMVMTDLPFISLFLASFAFFVEGVNGHKTRMLFLSGVFAGLTVLTKYSGIFTILPLFLIYLAINGKLKFDYYKYLALPLSFFFLWGVHNLLIYGRMHFLEPLYWSGTSGANMLNKILSGITAPMIGGVFPLFTIIAYIERRRELFLVLLVSAMAFAFSGAMEAYLPGRHIVSFTTGLFFFGILVLLKMFNDSADKKNEKVCVAWFGLMLLNHLFVLPYSSARYSLFLLPPFLLLTVKKMRDRKFGKLFLGSVFVLTLGYAAFTAYPTYRWGMAVRDTADYLKNAEYPKDRTWFCDGWGFGYYMKKYGFQEICADEGKVPSKGDTIVTNTVSSCQPDSLDGVKYHLEKEIVVDLVQHQRKFLFFGVD